MFVEGPKAGDVTGACNVNSGVEKRAGRYFGGMGRSDYHVVVYAWTGFDTIYRRNACRVAYGGCVALDVSFPSELMGRVYSVLQNGYDGREYTAKLDRHG